MNKFHALLIFAVSLSVIMTSALAASSLNSPSACSGQWNNCVRAFADDANRAAASVTSTSNKTGTWNNYGFSIPNSSTIDNVIVRADFFASNIRGYINVRVSGDGGATFGPSHVIGGNTAEQTFLINVNSDTTWTPAKLSNANLRVQATCFKQGSGNNPTCRLDWIPVQVDSTPFDFAVSVNPSNKTVIQGGNTNTTTTVSLLGGVSQQVVLTSIGCPPDATCLSIPASGIPPYTSTFTVITNSTTPLGTYFMNVTGTGDGKTRTAIYLLTVNPP